MPVSRRGVVGGLIALPIGVRALSGSPVVAQPMPVAVVAEPTVIASASFPQMYPLRSEIGNLHPLFGVHVVDTDVALVYTLDTRPADAPGKLRFEFRASAVGVGDAPIGALDVFPNLVEAEDALFARLPAPHREVPKNGIGMTGPNIIRATNMIARNTRRGAGNTLMMHRSDLALVTDVITFTPNFIPRRIGRWDNVGSLLGISGIQVWVSDNPPPSIKRGHALVGYRGNEFDAGAYLVVFPGNRIGVYQPDRPFVGYFHTVGLTREARLPYMV